MTIAKLCELIEAENMTPDVDGNTPVSCGYTCDLLSWVMAHGRPGMAWVTVQTHINVVAVAVLMEMAAVILPESIQIEPASLQRAKEEGLAVLVSPLTAYAICGRMAVAGVPASN